MAVWIYVSHTVIGQARVSVTSDMNVNFLVILSGQWMELWSFHSHKTQTFMLLLFSRQLCCPKVPWPVLPNLIMKSHPWGTEFHIWFQFPHNSLVFISLFPLCLFFISYWINFIDGNIIHFGGVLPSVCLISILFFDLVEGIFWSQSWMECLSIIT